MTTATTSADYEALPDPEQFKFCCGGPACQNYVWFESSWWWDDEDLAVGPDPDAAWLEAAIQHCGYSAEEQEPIRLTFALAGRLEAWRVMEDLDEARCPESRTSSA